MVTERTPVHVLEDRRKDEGQGRVWERDQGSNEDRRGKIHV